MVYWERIERRQQFGLWRWLICDPVFGNNILSRLHKVYVIGYTVAHYPGGVFN